MKKNRIRKLLKKNPIIYFFGSRLLQKIRDIKRAILIYCYPSGNYMNCNGVDVFCDFNNENFYWYEGDKENLGLDKKVISYLLTQANGNIFLDIGAHFGFFSAFLSEELAKKKNYVSVIAIEPDLSNFNCLNKTMARYKSPYVEFAGLLSAISNKDGTLKMYKSDQPCIHSYEDAGSKLYSEINSITLDSLVSEFKKSDKLALVKIDIDGSEPLFFQGGKKALKNHDPIIFIEFAPVYLAAFGVNVHDYFENLCANYNIYWVSYHSNEIKKVDSNDLDYIVHTVGNKVTDFVLSTKELSFENLTL